MTQPADGVDVAYQAVEAAVAQVTGGLLTGWVVIAEVMADDGSRALNLVHSSNLTPWAVTGMLGCADTIMCDDADD